MPSLANRPKKEKKGRRLERETLIHHQGIICGVAFDRASLRRITSYASVGAPWRLTSNTLLVIRNAT
jgi:hypothetical protein